VNGVGGSEVEEREGEGGGRVRVGERRDGGGQWGGGGGWGG